MPLGSGSSHNFVIYFSSGIFVKFISQQGYKFTPFNKESYIYIYIDI